jgi:endonuclease III
MKPRKPTAKAVGTVMRALANAIAGLEMPAVEKISEENRQDPFNILISTILSARTQDATTHAASTRLFRGVRTPQRMAKLRSSASSTRSASTATRHAT